MKTYFVTKWITNQFQVKKSLINLLLFQLNIERKAAYGMSANPICKFSASRSLSCAMELNITPPCLWINGLGHDVFIIDSNNEKECRVQSNHIAPMPMMVIFLY